jgi:hypothetical protein
MLGLVGGFGVVGASVLAFWYILPVDGKLNPILKPKTEPWVVTVIVALLGLGVALIINSAISFLK